MMEVRVKGSAEDLELVNSCQRERSNSRGLFSFGPSVSSPAALLINTQASPSDIQWPAWVSLAVNNKLFGFTVKWFLSPCCCAVPVTTLWYLERTVDVVRTPTLTKHSIALA